MGQKDTFLEIQISMSLSKFSSERQLIEDLIVDHISKNAHLYLPNLYPAEGIRSRIKVTDDMLFGYHLGEDVDGSINSRPIVESRDTFSSALSSSMASVFQFYATRSSKRAKVPLEIKNLDISQKAWKRTCR